MQSIAAARQIISHLQKSNRRFDRGGTPPLRLAMGTDAGFDEYEFLTVHEEDVCDTCDGLDGQHFKLKDAVVGVNMPPLHPFCRCRISAPEETEADIQADIDRMLEGTSIEEIERKLDAMIAEQKKELTDEQNSDIMNDISKGDVSNNDISITQDAINSVPLVEIEGFTHEQNIAFQNAQKEILEAAKDLPLGTEVGAIYRADTMERIGDIVIGGYGKHTVDLPNADMPFISIHNHPDGKTLSPKDIDKLIGHPNMVAVAAIGNNAVPYVLQPLDNVNMVDFIGYASGEIEKLENQKDNLTFDEFARGFEDIWKGSERFGIKYTQIQNNT